MKYVKTLGLAVVVVAALMALAGASTASATVLCQDKGCEVVFGAGTHLASKLVEGTKATLSSSFFSAIVCEEATTEGEITKAGSSTETVVGTMSSMTFSKCNRPVSVIKAGTVEAHTDSAEADSNGRSTVSGSEVTVEPLGLHCIFTTKNTEVGTIVGGEHSVTKISSAPIPRTGGRSGAFCGSTASMTAEYGETKPGAVFVK